MSTKTLLGSTLALAGLLAAACTPNDGGQSSPTNVNVAPPAVASAETQGEGFRCDLTPEQAARITPEMVEPVPADETATLERIRAETEKTATACTTENLAVFRDKFPQVAGLADEGPKSVSLQGNRTEEDYAASCNRILAGSVPALTETGSVYCIGSGGATFRFRQRPY